MRSCYDEGKRTAETLTMDYHRGAGVEVICMLQSNILNTGASYLANLSNIYILHFMNTLVTVFLINIGAIDPDSHGT